MEQNHGNGLSLKIEPPGAEKPSVTPEDGITYELTEQSGETTLRLMQGDFSVMAEGEKYYRLSAEVWDRVLPKIKALAENEKR